MEASPESGHAMIVRQVAVVFALEMSRIVRRRRLLPVLLLAALPVGVAAGLGMFASSSSAGTLASHTHVFHDLLLGATVFFGCAFIFTRLFRAETLERTLHYYLLAPVRREALLLGKYVAGLAASWALFGVATVASYMLAFGLSAPDPWRWIPALLSDLGATLLACLAYGTLFLLFGLLFRNPILPVAALLAWESLYFLLPPALQAMSVRYHIGALTSAPPPLADGPVAILASPPPSVAVFYLLALTAAGLALSVWRLRRLEIRYAED